MYCREFHEYSVNDDKVTGFVQCTNYNCRCSSLLYETDKISSVWIRRTVNVPNVKVSFLSILLPMLLSQIVTVES